MISSNKQLDPLIELVKENDIDAYNQYFTARTIRDLGYRKTINEEEKIESEEALKK